MRQQTQINVNLDGLNKLTKDCKDTYARVGVLGNGAVRSGDQNISNYELALIHEFGTLDGKIPARSFLRMPVERNKKELLNFAEKNADKLLNDDVRPFFEKLGAWGQGIVQQAFDSDGFGQWPPNKQSTIDAKGGKDTPLIDTGNLRKSVSYDVKVK